jgi:hypothetical protein
MRKRHSVLVLVGAAVLGAFSMPWVVGAGHGVAPDIATVHAERAEECRPHGWAIVPSPSVVFSDFNNVNGTSTEDIWAVGETEAAPSPVRSLIEHWDGSRWSIVPSPLPSAGPSALFDVVALSRKDAWAVGTMSSGATSGLTMHWNGTTWTVVPSPNRPTGNTFISSVSAVRSNDVWAVGSGSDGDAFVIHWDGLAWSIVPTPATGATSTLLSGVTAVSLTNVWAVGSLRQGNRFETLTEHWDGSAWTIVPSPNGSGLDSQLRGVDARSAGDIWTVGTTGVGSTQNALVEHWDGETWSTVPSPLFADPLTILTDVSVASHDDAWVAGYRQTSAGESHAVIEHWDGRSWRLTETPGSLVAGSTYGGIWATRTGQVWATGGIFSPGPPRTSQALIEHGCVRPFDVPYARIEADYTPIAAATFPHDPSASPSSRRR